MAKLLLVRHGLTDLNAAFRFAGSLDSDLSPAGHRQIEKIRDRLVSEKIDAAFCSDLKRARVSAEIITSGRNVAIKSYSELREMNYGQVEGYTFNEINNCFPYTAASLINHDCKVKFPGGECFTDLEARVRTFAGELKQFSSGQTVLIVSHGGPLRMLVCVLLEAGLDIWWKLRIDNASLTIIETFPNTAVLNLLNDTSHLSDL